MNRFSSHLSVRDFALTAIFTAATAVLAQITIPIPPVPFSFGMFGVLLAVCVLPMRLAVLSQLVYVLLGAVGVPVFTGFQGGVQRLVGPTGGYLVAYILMALVMGWLHALGGKATFWRALGIGAVGLVILYLCGAGWLGLSQEYTVRQAFVSGILPFLPLDTVKIVMAAGIGVKLRDALHRANLIL